jgi:hypothetical protein
VDVVMGRRWRQSYSQLIVFGVYLVLTVMMTYPVALQLATHVPIAQNVPDWPVDDLDPWHSLWILWFVNHSLIDLGRLPFFTETLFYPRGVDLTYFGLITFPLLVSIPLVQLISVVAAHNLLLLMSLALAAYATFLLVDYLVQDKGAAFLAGMVYAFCPYHMVRFSVHFFMVFGAVWLPLYVLCLIKATREGKTTHLLLAALCFEITLLTNPYYLIYLLCFTGIYGLFHLWHPDSFSSRKAFILRYTLVVALSSLPALPVVFLALRGTWDDTLLYLPLRETVTWSADLLAFFLPSPYHFLWGDLVRPIYAHFTGNLFEQTVAIGYGVLFLSALAAFSRTTQATSFWLLAAVVFFVLTLGPFLHVYGRFLFQVDELPVTFPLPYLFWHFVPVLRATRAPSRFAVMLMLCLAVLVGFGLRLLISRCGRWRWVALARGGCLGLASLIIVFEYVSVPFPTVDARIPKVYERIGRDDDTSGSVWDVPLNKGMARYQYYQTAHHKRLLMGFGPRLQADLTRYADTFPMVEAFKDPDRFLPLAWEWNRQDALRLIDFFRLDVVVIHREHLQERTVERLRDLLMTLFPVREVIEEGDLSVFWMRRNPAEQSHWNATDYRWDFDTAQFSFMLFEGWLSSERSEDITWAWANGKSSRLWVFFPQDRDFTLELRFLPFTFPGSPPQGITIYVNERFLSEIEIVMDGWQSYALHVPHSYLTTGLNAFRFVYRYAASPAQVLPGNEDLRTFAVAFDFIAFRPE